MNFSSLDASLASISGFIDKLIPLIISVALVLFLIGIVQYVTVITKRRGLREGK